MDDVFLAGLMAGFLAGFVTFGVIVPLLQRKFGSRWD
jgi:hypothetical protein